MKKDETMEAVKASEVETTPIEETVTINLPLTRERQEDVFVSVNGRNFQIKRGEDVEVPKVVAEVLANSEKMDRLALQRQKDLIKSF